MALIGGFALQASEAAERAPRDEDFSPPAIAQIFRNCGAFKQQPDAKAKATIRLDSQGRAAAIVSENGFEYVIQYSMEKGKLPSGIVGPGVNVQFSDSPPPLADIEKHLANRLKFYRMAKAICTGGAIGSGELTQSLIIGSPSGGSSEDGYPAEYTESSFWEASWSPMINNYGIQAASNWAADAAAHRASCMSTCNDGCDFGADAAATGCTWLAVGLASTGVGAGPSLTILAACGTGVFAGKYWCKWKTCPGNCGGG